MRETFTSGSVGRAPGNRCLYPEPDCRQPTLLRHSSFRQQVSFGVGLQRRNAMTQTTQGGLGTSSTVSVAGAPPGTETLAVQWVQVAVPDMGVMLAAVARPSGAGPFPTVLLLHGSHGFAQEYVRLAQDLADGGLLAMAAIRELLVSGR